MKKLGLITLGFFLTAMLHAQQGDTRWLVKLKPGWERAGARLPMPVQPLYPVRAAAQGRGAVPAEHFVLTLPANADIQSALADWKANELVAYIEQDAVGYAAMQQAAFFPNDLYFDRQWSLSNDGSFRSWATADADVDMPEAWEVTQGSEGITVAILDSGIRLNHPEFAGRLWMNTDEVADNGVDDDGNGYIDDINGWDMVNEGPNVRDDFGHGTHVAGIIGANGNNGLGYAGADWYCKLMVLKVLDINGSGLYSWWARAIHYAVDNGADIINMSLGGTTELQTLADAVQYAYDHDVLIVASMQNFNSEVIYYPAGHTLTLAVGSSDPDDRRSTILAGLQGYGSNYGDHIDVVAPGNFIYGLSHVSDTDFGTQKSGTSQAAPLVTGIAALVWGREPGLTLEALVQRLTASAEDGVGDPLEDTPGWDRYYGYGRVNAYRALTNMTSDVPVAGGLALYPNPSAGTLTAFYDQGTAMPYTITLVNTTGQVVRTVQGGAKRMIREEGLDGQLPAGVYVVEVKNERVRLRGRVVVR
ncbi:S8 family serine peptidase [Fulvivirgaceae bacterium PWU5]|uniref:S8 family serine peptidase n=1 Tax=Dawidia cretensis TaxID=2782350 RepID=A0AAP2E3J3_9BACT|nr:S8 family serine peptidase [Dawidia cretensis]MBT1712418.1 S8 family serine peptidase [Dawidia cretensis]